MGCCDSCVNCVRLGLLRLINLCLTVLGLGMLAYGGYVAAEQKDFSILVMSIMGVGLLLTLLCGCFFIFWYNSKCYILFYNLLMSVLMTCQIVAAICFTVPSLRKRLVDKLAEADAEQVKVLNTYTEITGYIMMGLAATLIVVVYLAYSHRNRLVRQDRDDNLDAPLNRQRVELERGPTKTDEARSQLRNKYAHLYDQYGIRTDKKQGGMSSV